MPTVNGINSDDFGRDDVIRAYMVSQYFGGLSVVASAGTAVNNLTTNSSSAPLAAAQGVVLKALIDAQGVALIDGGTPDAGRTIQIRHGTAAQWASNNPVLAPGEIGVELDTGKMKVGFGGVTYNARPYLVAAQNSLTPASATLPPTVDAVNAALASFGSPGVLGVNVANDIAASRSLTAADFDGNIRRVTAAAAITVPTIATMGLTATPNQLRTIGFLALSTPTFEAGAGVTINGTAGPAAVLPVNGSALVYGFYTLTQTAVGANTWALQ